MKRVALIFAAVLYIVPSFAQHVVTLRNLWAPPQVHVLFEGYTVSFTIKDIDKALALLSAAGDSSYGRHCGLDTARDYEVELYSGLHQQYHYHLQPLMQNGVGVFLLSAGHAVVEGRKHKKMPAVTMDFVPPEDGEQEVYVTFYDPETGARVFAGKMNIVQYRMDLGLD